MSEPNPTAESLNIIVCTGPTFYTFSEGKDSFCDKYLIWLKMSIYRTNALQNLNLHYVYSFEYSKKKKN